MRGGKTLLEESGFSRALNAYEDDCFHFIKLHDAVVNGKEKGKDSGDIHVLHFATAAA